MSVTPFGGLVILFKFLNKVGLSLKLAETMPSALPAPFLPPTR